MTPDPVLTQIEHWLSERCGLEVLSGERPRLEKALQTCAAAAGLDPERFAERLAPCDPGDALARPFIDHWVIPETSFFRTTAHFDALTDRVLPERRAARGPRPIRIWSAACSTGPEAYSLAMVVDRVFGPRAAVEVMATDLREAALASARRAVYPERTVQRTPEAYREQYLHRGAEGWTVDPAIRSRVRFEVHNLASDPYPADIDVIFCRNALIYFAPPARRKVLEAFHRALAPGGYVFVGHSETLRDAGDLFDPVWFGTTFAFRRASGAAGKEPSALPGKRAAPVLDPAPDRLESLSHRSRDIAGTGVKRALKKSETRVTSRHTRRTRRTERTAPRVVALALDYDGKSTGNEQVKTILLDALRGGMTPLVIHLERVDYLDRDATVWLRRAVRALESEQVPVALAVGPEPVRAWLEREWGGDVPVFPTVEEAQAGLAGRTE